MAEKQLKTRIGLRRDLEANFSSSFKPLKGEVLFVESNGKIRVKVGDGVKTFASLNYLDNENNIIVWGYYLNSKFYTDSTYTTELEKSNEHIYIDKNRNADRIYIYDSSENKFVGIDEMIPDATASKAGVMKLYTSQGYNEDGTVTQKFFTESIDDILFGIDEDDDECLVLEKPW